MEVEMEVENTPRRDSNLICSGDKSVPSWQILMLVDVLSAGKVMRRQHKRAGKPAL